MRDFQQELRRIAEREQSGEQIELLSSLQELATQEAALLRTEVRPLSRTLDTEARAKTICSHLCLTKPAHDKLSQH